MVTDRALPAILACLLALPVTAPERYTIDPRHSHPVFDLTLHAVSKSVKLALEGLRDE